MNNKKDDKDLIDKVKETAANAAHTIGKEAGGLAVTAAIKGGALAMSASKASMKAVTKVAAYGATTELKSEIKLKDKEIINLKNTIKKQEEEIASLRSQIEQLKG